MRLSLQVCRRVAGNAPWEYSHAATHRELVRDEVGSARSLPFPPNNPGHLCLLLVGLHQGKGNGILLIGAELACIPGAMSPERPSQPYGVNRARYHQL